MQDFLIFDTEAEAATAETAIFQFGAALAAEAGYLVDDAGIHGKRNGVTDTGAAATNRWCNVEQRLTDGKWIVVHPKYHPAAADPDTLAALEAQLGTVTVETAQPDWWPDPEDV